MSNVKIYTAVSEDLSPPIQGDGFCVDMVRYSDYASLEARCAALAAENAGLKEWSPNPHSASMFEAIEKAEELMDDGMPELAMIEAFEILKMKRTPETDAFLAEVRASARNEGINYAASRLAAAFNHGFVDKPLA